MDLSTTLIAGGMTLAFTLFCGWRGARSPNPHRGPRLIPWRWLMVFGAAACLLFLIHLVHLNDS